MTEIGFYHLTRRSLEETLPRLLEKVVASGARAVVVAGDAERVDAVDRLLWAYRPDSWLPHGTAKEEHAADQPILLSTVVERPNGATVLVAVDPLPSADLSAFVRVLDLFDGRDSDAVAAARERWKAARAAGHGLTYWQERDDGGWTKAAEHVPAAG